MISPTQHLFVSASGTTLPGWAEAFPRAQTALPSTALAPGLAPGLVWLRMQPGHAAAEQIGQLRARFAGVPLVAMSDEPNDAEALTVFAATARGYCNSHAGAEVLTHVASVVQSGGLWIGEALMQSLLVFASQVPRPTGVPDTHAWEQALSEREREVAKTLAKGASNKEIASQLGIAERTVKAHVGAILDKLKVRDRLQLALLIRHRDA